MFASTKHLNKHAKLLSKGPINAALFSNKVDETTLSPRMQEFKRKLQDDTVIEKSKNMPKGVHPYQEKEPLEPFVNNTNPETGEVDGPRGPEPTRYGDWERKGRVTDF